MPIIFIIAFIVAICSKPKKRKVTVYKFPDYAKIQRERERQAEQARKEQERQRKERERIEKQLDRELQLYEKELIKEAAAKANQAKAKQNAKLAEQYTSYIISLKLELNDSDISITRYNQIQKEILRAQEKVIKLLNDADKAQYSYQAYETYINS
jgi:hypothetical protein